MTDANAVSDYIEFLLQRGGVSHIVSAPPGSTTSTLALTQRCLASGIAFPVPLPDGSVAIKVDGDVPPALAALDLVIEAVSAADTIGTDAVASETDDVEQLPAEESAGDAAEPVESETADIVDDALPVEAETTSMPEETEIIEEDVAPFEAVDDPAEGGTDAQADCSDPGGDNLGAENMDSDDESGEPPMFIAVPREDEAESETDDGPLGDSAEGVEECPEPSILTDKESESMTDDGSFGESLEDEPDGVAMEPPVMADDVADAAVEEPIGPGEATNEAHQDSSQFEAIVTQLEERFAALENGQAELALRIDSFSSELGEVASRPIPRPDVSEFNRGMARVTTALAQSFRRIEDTIEGLAQDNGSASNDVADALAKGFSALAEAVSAAQKGQGGSAAELEVIASMQQTLSHQLAKLLEANQSPRVPMMEEFLMDIRHATAELLAEQTRVAKTG